MSQTVNKSSKLLTNDPDNFGISAPIMTRPRQINTSAQNPSTKEKQNKNKTAKTGGKREKTWIQKSDKYNLIMESNEEKPRSLSDKRRKHHHIVIDSVENAEKLLPNNHIFKKLVQEFPRQHRKKPQKFKDDSQFFEINFPNEK